MLLKYKLNYKIATLGCSHSSFYAGTPWPVYLQKNLNCNLLMGYSCGAGNEMNLEKLKILIDQDPNLIIVQLTDPARLTLPICNVDYTSPSLAFDDNLIHPHIIGNNCYYTFNPHENEGNLKNLTNSEIVVDNFILNHVLLSDYNLFTKVLHTMCTMAFMAKQKNIPIVFFSWVVDIKDIIVKMGYQDIFKDVHIIPDYVENFIKLNNIPRIPKGEMGEGHYASANHSKICKDYILPYLRANNLV